jgi:hypothetical protein
VHENELHAETLANTVFHNFAICNQFKIFFPSFSVPSTTKPVLTHLIFTTIYIQENKQTPFIVTTTMYHRDGKNWQEAGCRLQVPVEDSRIQTSGRRFQHTDGLEKLPFSHCHL